jgi:hypothetical protein
MNTRIIGAAFAAILLSGTGALAHHSFAMFDSSRSIVIKGTVKEFQWTNPHSWIQIMVLDDKGVAHEWSIEGASINGLARQGWKSSSLKPGDVVSIQIHPQKNGQNGGSLMSVELADGTILGDWIRPSAKNPGGGAGLGLPKP